MMFSEERIQKYLAARRDADSARARLTKADAQPAPLRDETRAKELAAERIYCDELTDADCAEIARRRSEP